MQRSTQAALGGIVVQHLALYCLRILLGNVNLLCLLSIARAAKLQESNRV